MAASQSYTPLKGSEHQHPAQHKRLNPTSGDETVKASGTQGSLPRPPALDPSVPQSHLINNRCDQRCFPIKAVIP